MLDCHIEVPGSNPSHSKNISVLCSRTMAYLAKWKLANTERSTGFRWGPASGWNLK